MSSMKGQRDRLRSGERGSIMIMTAIFAVLLLLMVGMAIDLSRIYMVRAELQNAADAAALTGARELNGGDNGIDKAVTQATSVIANSQGFGKANVTIQTIEFAVDLDGAYMDAQAAKVNTTVSHIQFVRVTTQATSTNILFASSALGASRSESRQATAGQSIGLNGICDFFPAAVALIDAHTDVDHPGFDPPDTGTLMNLNFNQGSGNGITLAAGDYAILEVPQINGNGTGETAVLTAGIPNFCRKLGDNINMTPSSNQNNGPKNSGDGMNTRFGIYANGYGNALTNPPFPPDTQVDQTITYNQYINGTPAGNDRRRLVLPIILPGSYPAYTTNIQAWGIFFLRNQVPVPNNCSHTPGCGAIPVEYGGRAPSGTGDPTCSSPITTAVLYR